MDRQQKAQSVCRDSIVRCGPLSWAQQWHWLECHMPREDRWFSLPISNNCDVPDGISVDQIQRALSLVLAEHEVLRTYFSLTSPEQFVVESAELDLTLIEIEGDEPLDDAVVSGVTRTLTQREFDLQNEVAWRVGVIMRSGKPVKAVIVNHHIAADGWGAANLIREIRRAMDAVHSGIVPAVDCRDKWHPLDQATWEGGPEARKASDRAVAQWMRAIESDPFNVLSSRRGYGVLSNQSHFVRLRSARLASACMVAVRRLKTSATALLLSAFAYALAEHTGCTRFAIETIISNRFRRELLGAVAPLSLPVPVRIDLPDYGNFDSAVRQVFAASVQAYRYGLFDPAALVATEIQYVRRRGVNDKSVLDLNYHLYNEHAADESNDHLNERSEGQDEIVTSTEVGPGETVFVDVTMQDGLLQIDTVASDHLLAADDVEYLVRRAAELVTHAADHGAPLPVVGRRPVAPGWRRVGNGWVNVEDTSVLLNECPAVRHSAVFVTNGEIRAYVVPEGEPPEPGALRAWVLDRIADRRSVAAPHRYVLCRSAPSTPDESAWVRTKSVDLGEDAASPGDDIPITEVEVILARILEELIPRRAIRMDTSFSENGGLFLMIPSLIAALRAAGYASPTPNEILSPVSLRHLAARLLIHGRTQHTNRTM